MSDRNQISRIEEYHRGNMSSEEMMSFEKDLASNPELRSESNFQGDIINGIKEIRKSQLKARLDAIDVAPGWLEFAQQSTLVKSFGGVALATLIGTGVYFVAEEERVETKVETIELTSIDVPEMDPLNFEWNIKALEATKTASIPTKTEKLLSNTVETSERQEEISVVEVAEPNKNSAEKTSQVFTPAFTAPVASEVTDESEPSAAQLETISVSESAKEEERKPIDVETENTRSAKIKYKYYDGKLFLSGNFQKEPYEIIEINSVTGRRIYLLHQNKYYEVKTTDRMTELPEVRSIKLIQELRLIKANK